MPLHVLKGVTLMDFHMAVTNAGQNRCLVCKLYGEQHGLTERCIGAKWGHHLIPKRMLWSALSPIPGREMQELAACDPRNGIPVRDGHHQALEDGRISIHPDDLVYAGEEKRLTTDVYGFIQDWGLEAMGEKVGIVLG